MKLWLVGEAAPRWCEEGWYFIGVFDSEEKAKAAANTEGLYVSQIELNAEYEACGWPQYVGIELKAKS